MSLVPRTVERSQLMKKVFDDGMEKLKWNFIAPSDKMVADENKKRS